MKCARCSTECPEGSLFCLKCGYRLDGKKRCVACGKDIPVEAAFCPLCGAPQPIAVPPPAPYAPGAYARPAAAVPPQGPAVVPPAYARPAAPVPPQPAAVPPPAPYAPGAYVRPAAPPPAPGAVPPAYAQPVAPVPPAYVPPAPRAPRPPRSAGRFMLFEKSKALVRNGVLLLLSTLTFILSFFSSYRITVDIGSLLGGGTAFADMPVFEVEQTATQFWAGLGGFSDDFETAQGKLIADFTKYLQEEQKNIEKQYGSSLNDMSEAQLEQLYTRAVNRALSRCNFVRVQFSHSKDMPMTTVMYCLYAALMMLVSLSSLTVMVLAGLGMCFGKKIKGLSAVLLLPFAFTVILGLLFLSEPGISVAPCLACCLAFSTLSLAAYVLGEFLFGGRTLQLRRLLKSVGVAALCLTTLAMAFGGHTQLKVITKSTQNGKTKVETAYGTMSGFTGMEIFDLLLQTKDVPSSDFPALNDIYATCSGLSSEALTLYAPNALFNKDMITMYSFAPVLLGVAAFVMLGILGVLMAGALASLRRVLDGDYKRDGKNVIFLAVALGLLAFVLAVNIIAIGCFNDGVKYFNGKAANKDNQLLMSLGIHPAQIFTMIFAVGALLFQLIFSQFSKKERQAARYAYVGATAPAGVPAGYMPQAPVAPQAVSPAPPVPQQAPVSPAPPAPESEKQE